MFVVTVGLARPEEAFQPILLASWDNVNMQMRDALAYSVINCNEGAFGQEPLLDSKHEQLGVRKQWTHELGWQLIQGWDVLFGDEQTVPWKNRAMVQKGQGKLVFKDPITRYFTLNDVAKRTRGRDCIRHGLSRR